MPQGYAYEFDEDQKGAADKSGALNFVRGPDVVERKGDQEAVGSKHGSDWLALKEGERPAREGGRKEAHGSDENEPLVNCRIRAGDKREEDEDRENKYLADGDDVKKSGVHTVRRIADQCVGGGENAENDYRNGKAEAEDAEAAVNVHAVAGDQGGLHQQEKNPAGKNGTMNVDDGSGKRRAEDSSEKVITRKADKNADEDEGKNHGEKEMIVTAAWCGFYGERCLGGDGGQCFPFM